MTCKYCDKWINLGRRCTMGTHGECDCPKCQGMCECDIEEDNVEFEDQSMQAAELISDLRQIDQLRAIEAAERISDLQQMVEERDLVIQSLRTQLGCAKTDNMIIKSRLGAVIASISDAAVDLEKVRDYS